MAQNMAFSLYVNMVKVESLDYGCWPSSTNNGGMTYWCLLVGVSLPPDTLISYV